MPKRKDQETILKANPLPLALLLTQFILIKIGTIPLGIVKLIFTLVSRKRGRPRKTPFIPFYLNKIKSFFDKRISAKAKVSATILGISTALVLYTFFILTAAYQLPSPKRLASSQAPITTEIYDRNGKLLYRLYEGTNRALTELNELPQYLIKATLSAEDKNFYAHNGIDLWAIARAIQHNYQNGKGGNGALEGASTITQQLIKNSLLTPEKTYTRKIKEVILALWADATYTKDEILAMYLNNAPYGGPHLGVKAASQAYFGKEPKDLSLAESAFLAGLPASPTQFSPFGTHPELGIERKKQVLRRMVEDKYISQDEAQAASEEKLNFKESSEDILAPHFVFYIKDYLSQKYGQGIVSQGGLKIYTTLDLGLQQEVEKIVKREVENLASLNVKNGAAMVLDAKTGQILAMVGSKDYKERESGNFNVTLSLRQPGSSIKPITYATAFKKGYSPGNTILDAPVTFRDQWGNSYSPLNYDGKFRGPISLRTALASSLNTPAVRLLGSIGISDMIQTAKDLGITSFNDSSRFGLSLTLGGGDVRMIEMMGVYGTFSQMGVLRKPTGILKVMDSKGNILEEYEDKGNQALQPEVAYLINHILADNNARSLAFGPNSLLNIPPNVVSVKTGTSDNKRDNLCFGYTDEFVVGVWVGNSDNQPMNQALTSGITGAAPIWNKIMKGILAKHPSKGFSKPSGIVDALVDGRRDLTIAGNIPKALVRVKQENDEHSSTGYKTTFFDAFSAYATSSAVTRLPAEQAAVKNEVAN